MSHAIRAAHSQDGLTWTRTPTICVPPIEPEIATVRPTLLRGKDGTFEMYFAARGRDTPYVIGRALSPDGHTWCRAEAGIAASDEEEWEGGALTYPAVFEQLGQRWLLFNGRGYGATGFGIAVWEAG